MNRRSFLGRAVAVLAGLVGIKAAPAIAAPVVLPITAPRACYWTGLFSAAEGIRFAGDWN